MPVHAVKLFQVGARIALKNIETLFFQHPGASLAEIVKGLIDSTDDKIARNGAAGDLNEKNWMLEGRKWASESFGRNWVALIEGKDEATCDAWVKQRGDPSWKAYDQNIGAGKRGSGGGAGRLKSRGNEATEKKDPAEAVKHMSTALDVVPLNPIYQSNRTDAHSAMEGLREADESGLVQCMVRVLEKWIVLQVEAAQKVE